MPEAQKYIVETSVRNMASGEKISCGKHKTSVEKNNKLVVDLPQELPELWRIEIEFFGKAPGLKMSDR